MNFEKNDALSLIKAASNIAKSSNTIYSNNAHFMLQGLQRVESADTSIISEIGNILKDAANYKEALFSALEVRLSNHALPFVAEAFQKAYQKEVRENSNYNKKNTLLVRYTIIDILLFGVMGDPCPMDSKQLSKALNYLGMKCKYFTAIANLQIMKKALVKKALQKNLFFSDMTSLSSQISLDDFKSLQNLSDKSKNLLSTFEQETAKLSAATNNFPINGEAIVGNALITKEATGNDKVNYMAWLGVATEELFTDEKLVEFLTLDLNTHDIAAIENIDPLAIENYYSVKFFQTRIEFINNIEDKKPVTQFDVDSLLRKMFNTLWPVTPLSKQIDDIAPSFADSFKQSLLQEQSLLKNPIYSQEFGRDRIGLSDAKSSLPSIDKVHAALKEEMRMLIASLLAQSEQNAAFRPSMR